MLQADEVDDDYFTPVSSTSLANIFGNVSQSKEETGNEKLKYTPPKPQIIQKPPVQAKATECLFACAVDGHEWSNNVYTSRGKLGFAIIKIQKSGDHNLVLYDSNKTTLSCTAMSPKLEISIKNNSYISYYDNLQKYWSIYAAEEDAKQIVEMLTKFEVIIKQSVNTIEQAGPPEPSHVEQDVGTPLQTNLGSDTDSSINNKTKASILNRMANMGHSVLPTKTLIPDRSSDSSDTNTNDSYPKIVRHKPGKNIVKRNFEHNVSSEHTGGSYHKRNIPVTVQTTDNTILHTSVSRQLVPTTNTSLITGFNCNSSNEMGIFMSEQRISNSELRINMSRITDKVDLILDKVNNSEHKGANAHTEILMKLLTEYENKIKVYEELLKSNNVDTTKSRVSYKENETEILRNTIQKLEQGNKEKREEILALQNEIQVLKVKHDEEKTNQADNEDALHKKINDLETSLALKNDELMNVTKKCDSLSSSTNINNTDMESKLKNIMNDAFQTISVNFENNEVYAGETVKKLSMVNSTLGSVQDVTERESLLSLQSDLQQLIHLTKENLDALSSTEPVPEDTQSKNELDDEYALFMQEVAKSGAYDEDNKEQTESVCKENNEDSDIEDELSTLLGMKCAVYHTHKWGGQPSLHNAMVSALVPRQDEDQFKDLQVRVLFTHPTHAEMLPCPYYLGGECKFSDEQCRYSHGAVIQLSNLKEAIEPNFDSLKVGSRVLLKLKPPEDEDISITKKSTEKYHLWHRAVVKNVDTNNKCCTVKLEHGVQTGDKRKLGSDECTVGIEDIFPLNNDNDEDSESDDSISDTEYPESKAQCTESNNQHSLLVESSLENKNLTPIGNWEQHTRGMGSKIMLAMGYVPGTGLGAAGDGRVQPVEARLLPVGKSLDHCMAISEKNAGQDPMKVEQRLKKLQKKEEERNKRAYEREKERERRNVFNFLNKTLGGKDEVAAAAPAMDVKQSTSKDLNIEQFKITEDKKKLEREIVKLNSSLIKYPSGSNGHRSINMQIIEKNKELGSLLYKEQQITKEQSHRKDKQKMTIF